MLFRSELLEFLPPANRPELEQAGNNLKRVLDTLKNENETNAISLRKASDTIQHEIYDVAKSSDSGTYTQKGQKAKNTVPRAGLNVKA